jgi:hypothetical protein
LVAERKLQPDRTGARVVRLTRASPVNIERIRSRGDGGRGFDWILPRHV